jgi:hypothetical protein
MSEDTNECIRIFQLKDAARFVPIVLRGENGAVTFYGGDQAWYKTRVGRISGCGAVAAANIFAYLAMRNAEYKGLFTNDSTEISVETFLRHMDDVIKFVAPLSIPGTDIPAGGLTSLPKFARNCEEFAARRGVAAKGRCCRGTDTSFIQASAIIAEQLARDNPVALLIMQNRHMRRVEYVDAYGKAAESDMEYHWVAVTAMRVEEGRAWVDVSSEGAKAALDFTKVWNEGETLFGTHGLVYLDFDKGDQLI